MIRFVPLLRICCFLLFSLALLSGCEKGSSGTVPPIAGDGVNQPAPDFTLTDMQGNQVTLSQLRGNVVLLNFWATWCPPCREEMPSMEELHQRYKNQGLVLLAVNVEAEGYEAVSRFLPGKDYTFPILLDSAAEVQNQYKVFRFPETFIIDRNGMVVDKLIGARDWMSPKITTMLGLLLNG